MGDARSDLTFRMQVRDTLTSRALVERALRAARPHLRVSARLTAEVGVVIIGPAKMRTLNRTWRKRDEPTDVLSFPLHMRPMKGYTAVSLGDLFICPAIVRRKARAWGVPLRTQAQWTVIHGLLHLAGHDHERSAAAARTMSALERRILRSLS